LEVLDALPELWEVEELSVCDHDARDCSHGSSALMRGIRIGGMSIIALSGASAT
jgi:hypothetical protein